MSHLNLFEREIIMKKLTICILIFLTSACSNLTTSTTVNEKMLVGTWECVSSNSNRDLEIKVTYDTSGRLEHNITTRYQVPDVNGVFLYQVNGNGTWKVIQNTVYETIDEYEILPLNELSIAFEDLVKKELNKSKKTYSSIVTIEESQVNLMVGGVPMSCSRVSK